MNDRHEVLAGAAVTAWAAVAVPLTEIDGLRAQPGSPSKQPLGSKTLRFADELTVAGMAAMLHAIHDFRMDGQSFADWGILAAPRFPGRMITAANLAKQASEPHFSISPHIIPNHCLHSVSGAASVVLGIHGPNFGVGGGPHAVPEALATALSLLGENRLPGVWLILSEFDPEPHPDRAGRAVNPVTTHAAALALQPEGIGGQLRLTQVPSSASSGTVRELAGYVLNRSPDQHCWRCALAGLGSIELTVPKRADQ